MRNGVREFKCLDEYVYASIQEKSLRYIYFKVSYSSSRNALFAWLSVCLSVLNYVGYCVTDFAKFALIAYKYK